MSKKKIVFQTGTLNIKNKLYSWDLMPGKKPGLYSVSLSIIEVFTEKEETKETRTLRSEVESQRPVRTDKHTNKSYMESIEAYNQDPGAYKGDLETFIEQKTEVKEIPVIKEVQKFNTKVAGSFEVYTKLPKMYITQSVKNFITNKL